MAHDDLDGVGLISHAEIDRRLPAIDQLLGMYNGALVPVGGIILWSGSTGSIPTGWALCDGGNGTPDLTNRFVVGAGGSYGVGDTGGAATSDLAHTHASGSYATDEDTHEHSFNSTSTEIGSSSTTTVQSGTGATVPAELHSHDLSGTYLETAIQTDTHSHDVTGSSASAGSGSQENRPPYYALAYIMRIE